MTEFLKCLLIFLCDVPIKLVIIIFFPKTIGSFRCWVIWWNNVHLSQVSIPTFLFEALVGKA